MANITLILGGASSGKSRYAETVALSRQKKPVYIATARALDHEMRIRINAHQERRRKEKWHEVEAPIDLSTVIEKELTPNSVILVDCLTMWLNNVISDKLDVKVASQQLIEAITGTQGEIIFVSNEVGFGIVPVNSLARQFRDLNGQLHQDIAHLADSVLLVVAGIPIVVKTALEP